MKKFLLKNEKLSFSSSNIYKLFSGEKTKKRYILETAMRSLGVADDFKAQSMIHGLKNQLDAFEFFFKKVYGGWWHDTFVKLDGYAFGASPDILGDGFVADVKCPYTIENFFEQNNSIKKEYYYQLHGQMLVYGARRGYLVNYLTRPESFGQENWVEYDIPLKDRVYVHTIERDQKVCDDILLKVKENESQLFSLAYILERATEIESERLFFLIKEGKIENVKNVDFEALKNFDGNVFFCNNSFYLDKL